MKREFKFHLRKITALLLTAAMVLGMNNAWNVQEVRAAQMVSVEESDGSVAEDVLLETVTDWAEEDYEILPADAETEGQMLQPKDAETEGQMLQPENAESEEQVLQSENVQSDITENDRNASEENGSLEADEMVTFTDENFVKYFVLRYQDRYEKNMSSRYSGMQDEFTAWYNALGALLTAAEDHTTMTIKKSVLDQIVADIQENVEYDGTGGSLDFHQDDWNPSGWGMSYNTFKVDEFKALDLRELSKLSNVKKLKIRIPNDKNYNGTDWFANGVPFPGTLEEVEIDNAYISTTPDFSQCENLKVVKLTNDEFAYSGMASLNLGEIKKLESVTLDNTNICELYLTGDSEDLGNSEEKGYFQQLEFSARNCSALAELSLGEYRLKKLDLYGCSALESIGVYVKVTGPNQEVNFTDCLVLTDVVLTCSFDSPQYV